MKTHHVSEPPDSISNITASKDWHVVTDSHIGFSVFHSFCRAYAVPQSTMRQFADQVDARKEAGSLHPQYPISAIPRDYVRSDDSALKEKAVVELKKFLAMNESEIKASKVIIDFQGHLGGDQLERALEGFQSEVIEDIYLCYPSAKSQQQ